MTEGFDAIVVGARCAGAPTAMLLARKGYRVLLVDRARFPSDTVSTHILHPPGVRMLAKWGLLERLAATGCPPIHTYAFDFGPFTLAGAPGSADAAAGAGAEVRERFTVQDVLFEDGRVAGIRGRSSAGTAVTERARVVVGADGMRSCVAAAVRPEHYDDKPRLLAGYYSYWSGLPMEGRFETYIRERCGFAAAPTHDGMTMVIAGWPYAELAAKRNGVEGSFMRTIALVPSFAERLRAARREGRFVGMAVPNWFRKPWGPGWALVGDAGYLRDFITGQGMTDAFHDAAILADALDASFRGTRHFDDAMRDYQHTRDARVKPMYEFTCDLATLEPPPPERQQLFAAIHGDQAAMDAFVKMNAGTISPAEFFAPENIRAMTAAAQRVFLS
jgi:2-polyprenyl-6-methoxyphenol hydroxylase-like FAD-dependent oxidoreductase